MAVIGIDVGGTKLAAAVFSETGEPYAKKIVALNNREGAAVGKLIATLVAAYLENKEGTAIHAIGISVPGISRTKTGTVWAPNIPGWDDYPLLPEIQTVAGNIPVTIDSDRACYMLGELWQGNAKGCQDAIFLAVGTGIGAGILANGQILRGAHDIAGAVGWMALENDFKEKFISCGCFEYYASGAGIAKVAREFLQQEPGYSGILQQQSPENITAHDVFAAWHQQDAIAIRVISQGIRFWGMAVANLVSIFNPEKIIFGGGVFGPGAQFIDAIKTEATKWAQPISITQVNFEQSALGGDAGIVGAGFLALKNSQPA